MWYVYDSPCSVLGGDGGLLRVRILCPYGNVANVLASRRSLFPKKIVRVYLVCHAVLEAAVGRETNSRRCLPPYKIDAD